MAKAVANTTVKLVKKERIVMVPTPTVEFASEAVPAGVTLELTEQEAQALALLLGNVGGSPRFPNGDLTARGHNEQILYALRAAGYCWSKVTPFSPGERDMDAYGNFVTSSAYFAATGEVFAHYFANKPA
jgi:hypothetical protein